MLPSTGWLDHQFQAFHAQDGYAVTSCEEYWERQEMFNVSKFRFARRRAMLMLYMDGDTYTGTVFSSLEEDCGTPPRKA